MPPNARLSCRNLLSVFSHLNKKREALGFNVLDIVVSAALLCSYSIPYVIHVVEGRLNVDNFNFLRRKG